MALRSSLRRNGLRRTAIALVLVAGVVLPARAPAWVGFEYDREVATARLQTSFRTWTLEEADGSSREIRQVDSQLLSTLRVSEKLDLVLQTSGGRSDLRTTEVQQIDGPTDTRIKGFLHLLDQRLLLSAGLNLPTGPTELSDAEVAAVRAVSPTVLGFRTRSYGRGLGLDLGVAAGTDLRPDLMVGGGVSLLLHGEYDLDIQSEFQPSPEVAVTGGLDLKRERWTASFDLVYRAFGTDQLDGEDSFREGDQFEIVGTFSTRGQRYGLDVAVRDVIKADNELILAPSPATETRIDNGNTFWLSAVPRLDTDSVVTLKLPLDLVAANQSQQQTTSAWSLGFGLGAEVQLASFSVLDLRVSRLTGSSEDDELDLSGWDTAVSVGWQY